MTTRAGRKVLRRLAAQDPEVRARFVVALEREITEIEDRLRTAGPPTTRAARRERLGLEQKCQSLRDQVAELRALDQQETADAV